MFKWLSGIVLLALLAPSTYASSSFDEDTLPNYFVFEQGTWWDYLHSIEYSKTYEAPESTNIVDNDEDATYRTTAQHCSTKNCTLLSEEGGDTGIYMVREDSVYTRTPDNDDFKILDVDGFTGDINSIIAQYGITNTNYIDTEFTCEFSDQGESTIGGYTANIIENDCSIVIDYDDSVYGATPVVTIQTSDFYMENVGHIYSETTYYSDADWQYTTYETLVDSSLDLINFDSEEEAESAVAAENPFSDLSETHKNYDAILYLYDQGMIAGYEDGSFKPNQTLNRAELLKILVEGKGETPDVATYHDCFSDVATDWYAPYVCYAKEQGWVDGYGDGTFKPADTVNKVEALKMLLNSQGVEVSAEAESSYSDVGARDWFAPYVAKAKELGILEEENDSSFSPDGDRTRGSICENLYRLLVQE